MICLIPLGIVASPAHFAPQTSVGTLTIRVDQRLHPISKERGQG